MFPINYFPMKPKIELTVSCVTYSFACGSTDQKTLSNVKERTRSLLSATPCRPIWKQSGKIYT